MHAICSIGLEPEVQSKIEEMCDGTINQIELSRTAIAATAIPIAPREEQTRIANQLDTLLTRIQSCNDRLDAIPALLKRFRQTVLKAATSGDLTVDWRRSNFGEDAASNFTEVRVGDPYSHVIRAPKLWKEASLGATCDFVGGSQPPKSTFTYENGDCLVRLIQIRDYKSDRHTTYIPKNLARRFCNKTDVMIGRYGPPIFQILRGLEGAYNVALMKAVPRTKDIDLEYLYVFLRGDQLLKFIEAGSDRTAGQVVFGKSFSHLSNFPAIIVRASRNRPPRRRHVRPGRPHGNPLHNRPRPGPTSDPAGAGQSLSRRAGAARP
ncbi:MAG: hypothetical protein IPG42_10785 [Betaproteobacteria bacterium]|nr:hypothetical protein [Betaproteobacteria bacterium]